MHRSKSPRRDARAGITRYLQLYHLLSQELADGRFQPEQPLPSEPELVKLHGVSRTTVRRALDRLEKEGRIERRRGSGTYARQPREESPVMVALQHLCDLKSRGAAGKTLQAGISAVPMSLQSRHSTLGSRTHTLKRIRSHRGGAFQLESVYLSKLNGRSPRRGMRIHRVTHEMSAITADAATARHLQVAVGTPLLRLRTEFTGSGDRLLAVSDSVFRCDRASVHAAMERDGRAGRWKLKSA